MDLSDDRIRAAARDVVARYAAHNGAHQPAAVSAVTLVAVAVHHVSHGTFRLVTSGEPEPCIIEPDKPCDHCGFCESLGH